MTMNETIVYPVRIVAQGGKIENPEALVAKQDMQIGLAEENISVFSENSYIILDFEKELAGGVRIQTLHTTGEKKVRLRFGESVSECLAEIGEANATNDHSLRDFIVELQDFSDMTFANTGFRFVRMDVSARTGVSVKSIVAETKIDARPVLGKFECDDRLLNRIWNTAAYTLRLCLQNGYLWDGIKRDRLVWIGDLHSELRAAYALYGDLPEIRSSLDFASKEPLEWVNGIPMFSLWWLVNAYEDYLHTGDISFARAHREKIERTLHSVDKAVLPDGGTDYEYNFIDWVLHDERDETKANDELAGVYYLTKIAVTNTARLLSAMGADGSVCGRILSKLENRTPEIIKYKQAATLAWLSGDKTRKNLEIIKSSKAAGVTVFLSYPILKALCEAGEYALAREIAEEYFGGMLNLGATSFWEDFDSEFAKGASRIDELPEAGKRDFHREFGVYCYRGLRHSLCHGWSSGVAAYIAENILGVRERGVGGTEIEIDAHLSGLTHVKGVYPTRAGNIEMEYALKDDGKIDVRLNAPDGIKILSVNVEK